MATKQCKFRAQTVKFVSKRLVSSRLSKDETRRLVVNGTVKSCLERRDETFQIYTQLTANINSKYFQKIYCKNLEFSDANKSSLF